MRFWRLHWVLLQVPSMIGVICMSQPARVWSDYSMPIVLRYHLLIGGSLLQSFSLFMLSLTKPGQYYQVRHPAANISYKLSHRVGTTGLSCSRDLPWHGSGDSVRPDPGGDISLFPPTSYACNEPRRSWVLTRIGRPSHHVEQLV